MNLSEERKKKKMGDQPDTALRILNQISEAFNINPSDVTTATRVFLVLQTTEPKHQKIAFHKVFDEKLCCTIIKNDNLHRFHRRSPVINKHQHEDSTPKTRKHKNQEFQEFGNDVWKSIFRFIELPDNYYLTDTDKFQSLPYFIKDIKLEFDKEFNSDKDLLTLFFVSQLPYNNMTTVLSDWFSDDAGSGEKIAQYIAKNLDIDRDQQVADTIEIVNNITFPDSIRELAIVKESKRRRKIEEAEPIPPDTKITTFESKPVKNRKTYSSTFANFTSSSSSSSSSPYSKNSTTDNKAIQNMKSIIPDLPLGTPATTVNLLFMLTQIKNGSDYVGDYFDEDDHELMKQIQKCIDSEIYVPGNEWKQFIETLRKKSNIISIEDEKKCSTETDYICSTVHQSSAIRPNSNSSIHSLSTEEKLLRELTVFTNDWSEKWQSTFSDILNDKTEKNVATMKKSYNTLPNLQVVINTFF